MDGTFDSRNGRAGATDSRKVCGSTSTDTRKKSATEALINSFGGYPIGYALGIIILPLSVGWISEDPLMANAFITLAYAVASFVRIYFLRRVFERLGFDDNFIRLGLRGLQRARVLFSR